jgi:hypothetical protein
MNIGLNFLNNKQCWDLRGLFYSYCTVVCRIFPHIKCVTTTTTTIEHQILSDLLRIMCPVT